LPGHEQRPPEDRPRFRWLKNPPDNPPPGPLGIHDWSARTRLWASGAAMIAGIAVLLTFRAAGLSGLATLSALLLISSPFVAIIWIWRGD
jgi:hypothetical protein